MMLSVVPLLREAIILIFIFVAGHFSIVLINFQDARDPPHKYTLTVNSQSDPSEGGLSPLHAAVISGLPEMCVVLLNQGANVDLHAPPSMNTPLHFACQYNRAEVKAQLFLPPFSSDDPINVDYRISSSKFYNTLIILFYNRFPKKLDVKKTLFQS